ncbi:MAG TPA: hypothetical protein VGI45_08275 [Terracidiphilus sp.]|jgi:6-phosphogluconolactonase (cycloisomerase 2 family)
MGWWTRSGFALLASAFCLGVAVGCGGGQGSTTTATPTPTPPAQTGPASGSEFLYALGGSGPVSGGIGEVYASALNPNTGQLTEPVDATPSSLPAPIAMFEQLPPIAFGKYLYAPGYDQLYYTDTVFPFSITGTQGQLTAQSNYPVDFGESAHVQDFLIDGLGRYIYANFYQGMDQYAIQAFPINQNTGAIIRGTNYVEPNFTGTLVLQAADPAGKYLYAFALTPGGPEILVYAINASTGMVTEVQGSPFPVSTQGDNINLFVSPSGKFLYFYGTATDQSNLVWPALYIYSVDSATGKPTPAAASPIMLRNANGIPKFSPTGNLLYMPERFVDKSGNPSFDIGVFKVNQTDGTISMIAVSSVSTAYSTFYPDPSGKVLLIGPGGSNYQTFWSYLVDDSTGALTPAQGSPFFANDPNTLNQFYTIVRIP